jgi:hypothetical protein
MYKMGVGDQVTVFSTCCAMQHRVETGLWFWTRCLLQSVFLKTSYFVFVVPALFVGRIHLHAVLVLIVVCPAAGMQMAANRA